MTRRLPQTLQAAILQQLESRPEARALAFPDADGKFAWLSRSEVLEQARSYAQALAYLGCRPGDVCVLVRPSDHTCAMLLLGILLRGAQPLLIAPPVIRKGIQSSLVEIIQGVVGRVRPALVVATSALRSMERELVAACPQTRIVFGNADLQERDEKADVAVLRHPADLAALQLTSGTTGIPRVCAWRQRDVMAALEGMRLAMRLSEEDVCFNWTPLYHDMGLVNNFLLCLTQGVPLALLAPTEFLRRPARWLCGLQEVGASITWSPNFGFAITAQRVQDEQLEGVNLKNVRAFWNAAEKVHRHTMDEFARRFSGFGLRREALKTNFGCAENVGGATFSGIEEEFRWERVATVALQEEGIARPPKGNESAQEIVGVGRAVPGLQLRIESPDGELLADGHVGEIVLETPSRMQEYLGDAEATRLAVVGEGLHTGDLGYLRDGELFWAGRVQERMNVRGRKLDPSEFERTLLRIPGLRQGCFAVFGVDDLQLGTQRPVLVSELREPVTRPYEDILSEIREKIFDDLGVVLDDVLLVGPGRLPKTSSGKRRHRHFRELYLQRRLEPLVSSRKGSVGSPSVARPSENTSG